MNSLSTLEKPEAAALHLQLVEDENGLMTIEVNNPLATAQIALQGAHVTQWQPKNVSAPVLWLSKKARHIHGRSIRGGVPICWPWFGAHPTNTEVCPHGFARVMPWRLIESNILDSGATRLVLQIIDTPVAQKQLEYPYELTLTLTIGETLQMELATKNNGDEPFEIGEALHTYFQVSDVETIAVSGLEGTLYADKVKDFARDKQKGALTFHSEFDRVYIDTQSDCVIEDKGLNRKIRIKKTGSRSTVVWNPWKQKAAELSDMGDNDDWRHMICVESANALDNVINVAPHSTHVLTVEYSVTNL